MKLKRSRIRYLWITDARFAICDIWSSSIILNFNFWIWRDIGFLEFVVNMNNQNTRTFTSNIKRKIKCYIWSWRKIMQVHELHEVMNHKTIKEHSTWSCKKLWVPLCIINKQKRSSTQKNVCQLSTWKFNQVDFEAIKIQRDTKRDQQVELFLNLHQLD